MLKEKDRQNFKPYIKSFLQENIRDILFIWPPARNVPKWVCTKLLQNISVQKSFENSWDSYKNTFNTAKMIRKDILAEKNWEFTGSFDGFDIPNSLATLLNWNITGPKSKITLDCTKKQDVDKSIQMLSEIIMGIVNYFYLAFRKAQSSARFSLIYS